VYFILQLSENIIFEGGKFTRHHTLEKIKRWQTLAKLQSRARLSEFKLNQDYANIKNTVNVDLRVNKYFIFNLIE